MTGSHILLLIIAGCFVLFCSAMLSDAADRIAKAIARPKTQPTSINNPLYSIAEAIRRVSAAPSDKNTLWFLELVQIGWINDDIENVHEVRRVTVAQGAIIIETPEHERVIPLSQVLWVNAVKKECSSGTDIRRCT